MALADTRGPHRELDRVGVSLGFEVNKYLDPRSPLGAVAWKVELFEIRLEASDGSAPVDVANASSGSLWAMKGCARSCGADVTAAVADTLAAGTGSRCADARVRSDM